MTELSTAEIADMLRRDADGLARVLLPHGAYNSNRSEWKCRGRLSPTGFSISVHVASGPKQGVCGFWNGSETGGDMLDLIRSVHGLDHRRAIKWAKNWLGVGDDHADIDFEELRRRAKKVRNERAEQNERDRLRRLFSADEIWSATVDSSPILSAYFASRGLGAYRGDADIRFHPGLSYPSGGAFPAMVARVSNKDGDLIGIHRTFLKPDGTGKAPVETPKLSLGDVGGGAVRIGGIWPEIGIAEGIETAIACSLMMGRKFPVWAALSTSGMRSLEMPDGVSTVRIFADADPVRFLNGAITASAGLTAADELSRRLDSLQRGLRVGIAAPPTGMDWLDVWQAKQKQERRVGA